MSDCKLQLGWWGIWRWSTAGNAAARRTAARQQALHPQPNS